MKIGITGGIGSGKSFVCQLLAERGISIYDCDAAAKRLMRSSTQLRTALTRLIGVDTYLPDGTLNKPVVARFLLVSDANAHAIDAIVHPAVAADFRESGMQWMECAILFESGFESLVDRVVVVTAPEAVRIQRIMNRDGISEEQARQWMAKQWPQELLRQRAHFEIVNDGEQALGPQIENIIWQLK